VEHLVQEIVDQYATERGRLHLVPLGVERILKQRPHDRPRSSKRSSAPRFHAVTREARRALRVAYRIFAAAFRRAAKRLRAGDRDAPFPLGSFPPALPFVGG
jgi:hypothetical protein